MYVLFKDLIFPEDEKFFWTETEKFFVFHNYIV